VPQTVLMLVTMGWFVGRVKHAPFAVRQPAPARPRRSQVVAPVSVEPAGNG
jgi:hypothetical protein